MTLTEWLDYQQRVHAREIDLGLDRVRTVWRALGAPTPAPLVITVGGTNGKGSTVAFLETMLTAAGKRVGAFTSPHLLRYNERIRVGGRDIDDAGLIDAFTRIEAARGEVPLTYFEYGTLAALLVFAASALDVALLEVGLGGRLDAVNLIDADAAIVTTVDLDHQDWLGNDRDAIGREKAGIFRAGRPGIIGDARAPRGLIDAAAASGALLRRAGTDFCAEVHGDDWRWTGWGDSGHAAPSLLLPRPALDAPCQIDNASVAIAALFALRDRLGWDPTAIADGVRSARVPARMQRFPGPVELIVDVAHNPQAARALAVWLAAHPIGARTHAVFGALADKDVESVIAALAGHIDAWHLGGLDVESARGLDAAALRERVAGTLPADAFRMHARIADALDSAFAAAGPGDRILAFGSFFVAATALERAPARETGA